MQIIPTDDGSYTLFNEELGETYHSRHGAVEESMHVYIRNGLQRIPASRINILEVGFGTGLNALLTAEFSGDKDVMYTSLEPALPDRNFLHTYYRKFDKVPATIHLLDKMLLAGHGTVVLQNNFSFRLFRKRLEDFMKVNTESESISENGIDLIYLDAFAPSKQPDIWCPENLHKLYEMMNKGGVLVTYCAQGEFKRNLKQTGFKAEFPKGAHGKREMTVAVK